MRKLGLIALFASAICIAGPPTIASAAATHIDPGRAAVASLAVTGTALKSQHLQGYIVAAPTSARDPSTPRLFVGRAAASYTGDRPADGTMLVSGMSAVNLGATSAADFGSTDSS